jgi:hypothetical protein
MRLRPLPLADSYPYSVSCPISCRPHGATLQRLASAPIFRPETLRRLWFFVALPAECVPVDCSSASNASARNVAVKMHRTTLPHRLRVELPETLHQSQTLVGNKQSDAFQTAFFQMPQKCRPAGLVFLTFAGSVSVAPTSVTNHPTSPAKRRVRCTSSR